MASVVAATAFVVVADGKAEVAKATRRRVASVEAAMLVTAAAKRTAAITALMVSRYNSNTSGYSRNGSSNISRCAST